MTASTPTPRRSGETGRILFQIERHRRRGVARAAGLKKALEGKIVLGLRAEIGIPARPDGPSLACRVRIKGEEMQVQLTGSDPAARSWVPFGKFTLPVADATGEAESLRLADALAEGLINRLVRAQVVKGPRDKGKLTYRIRIENVSPLRLNGLAAVGDQEQEGRRGPGPLGDQHPAAPEHDRAGERGGGQGPGIEARDPRYRHRFEWAVRVRLARRAGCIEGAWWRGPRAPSTRPRPSL